MRTTAPAQCPPSGALWGTGDFPEAAGTVGGRARVERGLPPPQPSVRTALCRWGRRWALLPLPAWAFPGQRWLFPADMSAAGLAMRLRDRLGGPPFYHITATRTVKGFSRGLGPLGPGALAFLVPSHCLSAKWRRAAPPRTKAVVGVVVNSDGILEPPGGDF